MPIRVLRAQEGWWRGNKLKTRLYPRHCVFWLAVQKGWQSQDDVILKLGWGCWQHQLLLLLVSTDSQERQVLIRQQEELFSCLVLSEMALSISPLAPVILGHTVIHFSIYFFLFIPVRYIRGQNCRKHLAKFCYCLCQLSGFFSVSFQIALFLFTFHILNTPVPKITSVSTILFLHCEYAA